MAKLRTATLSAFMSVTDSVSIRTKASFDEVNAQQARAPLQSRYAVAPST